MTLCKGYPIPGRDGKKILKIVEGGQFFVDDIFPGVRGCIWPMGMCCWMKLHFDDWITIWGVAFSMLLLEWSHTFLGFGVKENFPK